MTDVFLLVHPEQYPGGDDPADVAEGDTDAFLASREESFATRYAELVRARRDNAHVAVCLLDEHAIGWLWLEVSGELAPGDSQTALDELRVHPDSGSLEVTAGVPLAGWELFNAEPEDIGQAAVRVIGRLVVGRGTIRVGGYARRDCVQAAVDALSAAGYVCQVDEATSLPLTRDGQRHY